LFLAPWLRQSAVAMVVDSASLPMVVVATVAVAMAAVAMAPASNPASASLTQAR
jgi:hypothetical protein